ncbi:MAG: tRNA (adenosine(37)-N6)-threonylcarbamoyltransferase complex ATPase subunit type 1 TsaE [Chloroflexi bacterium]|nr:tRNA (adenosine(37)-N6)-threonylcarbamoyltransferase complex ATPase subunit type 1 TsaE [Chloroflexota bacterium]
MTQKNQPKIPDQPSLITSANREARPSTPPSAIVDFVSHSVAQTQRCGSQLAQQLGPGTVILLEGDLGAGKTTFTKGLAQGLGVEGYVNSPTFTLVNEYEGRLPVYHLDCYRLENGREALDFGIEEYLYGEGVTVIEWPERIREIWPSSYIRVTLSYLNETKRSLRVEPVGPEYVGLMQEFKKSAFGSSL